MGGASRPTQGLMEPTDAEVDACVGVHIILSAGGSTPSRKGRCFVDDKTCTAACMLFLCCFFCLCGGGHRDGVMGCGCGIRGGL
jgi:hypothetical protein